MEKSPRITTFIIIIAEDKTAICSPSDEIDPNNVYVSREGEVPYSIRIDGEVSINTHVNLKNVLVHLRYMLVPF